MFYTRETRPAQNPGTGIFDTLFKSLGKFDILINSLGTFDILLNSSGTFEHFPRTMGTFDISLAINFENICKAQHKMC